MDAVFVLAFGSAVVAAERVVPDAGVEGVLRLLVAAPVGAVLPLEVLVAAVTDPGIEGAGGVGSGTVAVRDALAALGELVARAEPGSSTERVGPGQRGLSFFPCKPRMTDVITVSQGESSREEDDQGVEGCFPAPCSGSGWVRLFLSDFDHAAVGCSVWW